MPFSNAEFFLPRTMSRSPAFTFGRYYVIKTQANRLIDCVILSLAVLSYMIRHLSRRGLASRAVNPGATSARHRTCLSLLKMTFTRCLFSHQRA